MHCSANILKMQVFFRFRKKVYKKLFTPHRAARVCAFLRRAFRGGRVPYFCRRAARRPRPQREAARLGRCPISPTARRSIRAGGFPRPAANKPRKPRVSAEKKTCLAAAFASRRRAGSPLRCSGPCRSIYPRRAQNIPLHCVPIPYPAVRARPPLAAHIALLQTGTAPCVWPHPHAVRPLPTRLAMPRAVRHRAARILDG